MERAEFEAFTKATESQLKEFYERLQQRAGTPIVYNVLLVNGTGISQ